VLAEVGRGNLSMGKVEEYIKTKSDEPARYTAPPSGLFLERVYYKDEKKSSELAPLIKI
jgi:tRNA pseudouridine38-40 synthase